LVVWRVLHWQIMGSLRPLTSLRLWHRGTIMPQIMQMYLEEPLGWWINPVQAGVKRRKKKGKSEEEEQKPGDVVNPPPFNPTSQFFIQLGHDYQGQKADKMKALRTFARGGDESLREAHARLRRLISATHGVTEQQAVQHWYSILDKELKTLVRNEALRLDEPPTLRFIFETSKQIEINLLEEKAAMGFLKREEKPQEKVKVAKASLPFHAANTSMSFRCASSVASPGTRGRSARRARATLLRVEDTTLDVGPKGTVRSSVGSFMLS
jgi:hypothetical protein